MSKRLKAAADDQHWYELPAALLDESGTVRLREPASRNRRELIAALRSGDYGKPFVIDDKTVRRLHFNLDFVQSEMTFADPYALNFAYVREMMAFLLFLPRPRHVVIVGLGGGSLSKFCYRQLPRAQVTTIEIDKNVIELAPLFEVPQDDPRLRIVHADAADYFAAADQRADVVLIDGCDKHGIAPALGNEVFYRSLAAQLRRRGLLVMNLIGKARVMEEHIRHLSSAFPGRIMVHKVSAGGNRLVFAFKDPMYMPDWLALQQLGKQLQDEHGLDFAAYARKLRHSRQFQLG